MNRYIGDFKAGGQTPPSLMRSIPGSRWVPVLVTIGIGAELLRA
ncbi:hypothetical protein BH09ACT7_BH09ACT7_28690 [soil metagenome]